MRMKDNLADVRLKINIKIEKKVAKSLVKAMLPEVRREGNVRVKSTDDGLLMIADNLSLTDSRRLVRYYLSLLKTAEESIRAVNN